jgi:hypothetical protein
MVTTWHQSDLQHFRRRCSNASFTLKASLDRLERKFYSRSMDARSQVPAFAEWAEAGAGSASARSAQLLSQERGACHAGESGSGSTRSDSSAPSAKIATDQDFASIRRAGEGIATTYDILGPMGSPSPGTGIESDAATAPDGVSAFVARVLDQLTLSAWLPAGFFTASVAVLLEFRSTRSVNILSAVKALTVDPWRVLVLIIPVLVIATMLTQAFSFEAIRTLEGYWRRRGLASIARTLMIRWQVHRQDAIEDRLGRAQKKAFETAKKQMTDDHVPSAVIAALRAQVVGGAMPSLSDDEKAVLAKTSWRAYSNAWHLAKIDHLLKDGETYPVPNRVLPTRLGNLIRATEDELQPDGDLQGFVFRRHAKMPLRIQLQHDRYRTRLEMYCTLVFVSAALCVIALPVLLERGIGGVAVGTVAGSFALLSGASYLAAVASASGYCAALRAMNDEWQKLNSK